MLFPFIPSIVESSHRKRRPEAEITTLPQAPETTPETPVEAFAHLPGPWFVAMVKSNHENRLAWWLLNQGIPYFLPRLRREGKCTNDLLLRGFVFIGAPDPFDDPEHPGHPGPIMTEKVKKSTVVYGFLFTGNQKRLQMEMALLSGPNVKTLSHVPSGKVKLGTRVTFLEPHCMAGLSGHVCGLTNQHQQIKSVAVELELLGQTVSVDVDPDQVSLTPEDV